MSINNTEKTRLDCPIKQMKEAAKSDLAGVVPERSGLEQIAIVGLAADRSVSRAVTSEPSFPEK